MACTLSSSTLLWCPVIVGFVFIFALGISTLSDYFVIYIPHVRVNLVAPLRLSFVKVRVFFYSFSHLTSPSHSRFFLVSFCILLLFYLNVNSTSTPYFSLKPVLKFFLYFCFHFFLFCFYISRVCTWRLTGDLCVTRRYRFIDLYIVHVWASNAAQKSTASVHTPKSSLSIHSFIIVI